MLKPRRKLSGMAKHRKQDEHSDEFTAAEAPTAVEAPPVVSAADQEKIRRATTEGLRLVLGQELPPELRAAVAAELERRSALPQPSEPVWIVKRGGTLLRDGFRVTVSPGTSIGEREAQAYRDAGFELERGKLVRWEDQLGFVRVEGRVGGVA